MVAGLIIDAGKLLLINNSKHSTLRIEPPGGKVENGETLRGATAREIKEELGIEVKVGRLFDIIETNSPEGQFSVYMYFCTLVSGIPETKEPEKSDGFGWYNLTELNGLKTEGKLVPNMVASLEKLSQYLQ